MQRTMLKCIVAKRRNFADGSDYWDCNFCSALTYKDDMSPRK